MRELDQFLNARNLLIKQRTNYDAAYAEFSWPKLDTFNWAIDYFDAIAHNNTAPALHIVEDSGHRIGIVGVCTDQSCIQKRSECLSKVTELNGR